MIFFLLLSLFIHLTVSAKSESLAAHLGLVRDKYPLHYLAYKGDPNKLEEALKTGTHDINEHAELEGNLHDGVTPLLTAIANNKKNAMLKLLNYSADRKDGWTALHYASNANDIEVAKILIAHGADVNEKMSDLYPSTPLHFAVKKGWKEMVSLLLESGANTSLRKENDFTPLQEAASLGDLEIVKILVEKGNASIYEKNTEEMTAFHFAVFEGKTNIVKYLIDVGMDVNTPRNGKATAMHDAAANGHMQILTLLLDFGGNPNIIHDEGVTPLLAATHNGQREAVDLLLQRGANASIAPSGESAVAMAKRLGDHKTKLLSILQRLEDPIEQWKNSGVCHFLSTLGLSKYYQTIKTSKVDGKAILEWNEQKLKDLGISDSKEISLILENIKIYKERPKNVFGDLLNKIKGIFSSNGEL